MDLNEKNLVFGLDIGTRSIVGIVGYKEKDRFIVVASESVEHETRSMLDGQIHDIGRVAETIKKVKESCEEKIGRELDKVCIAAAGRVLRTLDTHVDLVMSTERETKPEDVSNLMSLGIEKAYKEFNHDDTPDMKFYCVGYSVVRYYLNKLPITNLIGHKANQLGADIIATFLPDDVVDGLYRSVELAGLEVSNLTLEPIAAISVAIPEKFRMLNIALVDVGAGTSDISITKDGSIIAYGMIPMAGDAITEKIAMHCLVDFDMAEKIKRDSDTLDVIEYEDIMGLPQTIKRSEVLEVISDTILEEAEKVGDEIVRLNGGKSVSAVFVVGGGGIVTGYTDKLSQKLGIVPERVALRGSQVMGNIEFLDSNVEKTSLLVTPVGICLNYYEHSNNLMYVTFNGKRMKMYDTGKLTVVDVAMQAQFPNDGLFPKRGKALTYSVNGKSKIAKGELGEAATITINEKPADISCKVKLNDKIVIKESTAGVRARIRIDSLPEYKNELKLEVEGKTISIMRPVLVNSKPVTPDYEIMEDDRVEICDYCDKVMLLQAMDMPLSQKLIVNNRLCDAETKIYENFSIRFADGYEEGSFEDVTEEISEDEASDVISETPEETENVTNVEKEDDSDKTEAVTGGVKKITVIVNGKPVVMNGKSEYVFVDVFDYIDFDLSNPQGKGVVTNYNGAPAQYMNPINDGDVIEIYWKDEL